jgi:DNA-binding response OmpR family regulator
MEQIGSSILVVEDDPSVARMVVAVLRCAGFAPALASTGDEARAALVAEHAFDVVLLDLQLGSERGELIIESVRERGATVPPVVVFSALPADIAKAAAKRIGAAAVVEKTGEVTEIVNTIRLVAQRRA